MIVFSIGVVLCAVPLFAQGGTITLFGDPGGSDCSIVDTQPNSLVEVYVLHLFAPAVLGGAFSVPIPTCAVGLTWLADVRVFPVTDGFSPSGIAIGYGSCLTSPIHILTIQYWAQGSSESCCVLDVAGDPRQPPPGIWAANCDFYESMHPATGAPAMINPNETCPCFNVPVQETSWGRVKALYAE